MSLARIVAVARKEWREIVRDRIIAALAFLLAPMLMLVLGYGMLEDLEHIPLVVVDHDRSERRLDLDALEIPGHTIADLQVEALGQILLDRHFDWRLASGG